MKDYVDIIIVNYNTAPYLHKCIDSIRKNTRFPYRLILIDNNSAPKDKEQLAQYQTEGNIVLYNNQNLGTSKAWNQGIKAGDGKYVVILNPDIIVPPNWLTKMISCADSHSKIAIVGVKLVNQKGMITHAGIVERNGRRFAEGLKEMDSPHKYNHMTDCITICGACFLIKRANLSRLGYLDERFFMYTEETDYCFRARLLGYRVVRCPISVVHLGERSPLDRSERIKMHHNSVALFNKKWAHAETIKKLIRPEVLRAGKLLKSKKPAVYFVHNGKKHLIPDGDTFKRLGFNWDRVKVVSEEEIRKIPTGCILYI